MRDDAAYAAGNLVMMSRAANAAKHQHNWQSASELARRLEHNPIECVAGLALPEWRRIATLCSYVTELPHELAATLPMLVLPPNRLRLFNPVQALQALITRQLATPGWSQRLAGVEALLTSAALKRDFNTFVLALLPRMMQAGQQVQGQPLRWALEDAWATELVHRRWVQFAQGLSAGLAEHLVARAANSALSPLRVQQHERHSATEGWALEHGGFQAPMAQPRHEARKISSHRTPMHPSSLCH